MQGLLGLTVSNTRNGLVADTGVDVEPVALLGRLRNVCVRMPLGCKGQVLIAHVVIDRDRSGVVLEDVDHDREARGNISAVLQNNGGQPDSLREYERGALGQRRVLPVELECRVFLHEGQVVLRVVRAVRPVAVGTDEDDLYGLLLGEYVRLAGLDVPECLDDASVRSHDDRNRLLDRQKVVDSVSCAFDRRDLERQQGERDGSHTHPAAVEHRRVSQRQRCGVDRSLRRTKAVDGLDQNAGVLRLVNLQQQALSVCGNELDRSYHSLNISSRRPTS